MTSSGGQSILLVIGGGVAAYKALELVRLLAKRGIGARAILTRAGAEFVTPLSVGALTGDKVYQDLFDLTDEAFEFALPEVDKTIASLTYGRYLGGFSLVGDGEQGSRVDLEVKYEDPSQESSSMTEMQMSMEAQERFVATLTFTQKLVDEADLSVSLVYANEPEFLGMVDEEVTANFGIKWSRKRQS